MRGRLIIGLFIIAIGAVALLSGLNIIDISLGSAIATYWPLLLVAWGLGLILEESGSGGKVFGAIIIIIGGLFLTNNLGWTSFSIGWFFGKIFWPGILILLGIWFLIGFRSGGTDSFAFMGAVERKGVWAVKNGGFWAFMGGVDLDLREAIFSDQTTTLTINALMGGVEIIVPPDLAVICDGTSILGGVEFFEKNSGGIIATLKAEQGDVCNSSKVLRINGLVAMGGIEVKSAAVGERVNWHHHEHNHC